MNSRWYSFIIGALDGWNRFLDGFLFGMGLIVAFMLFNLIVK
jgi:hypothetical protein